MHTQFPYLSDLLKIKESTKIPNKSNEFIDRKTIRTRDYVTGILFLSELWENNPDLKGRIHGRIGTHREDLYHGIDFRIFSDDGKHLMDLDFTMNKGSYVKKIERQKHTTDYPRKIALINGSVLLWVAHEAERICYSDPRLSKNDIIIAIPSLKKSPKSIVLDFS